MNEIIFYDKEGKPCAYSEDEVHIYLFDGKPIAYLHDESIYSFNGFHIGFFINGWAIDNNGFYVFYTQNATGGPFKPFKKPKPFKSFKKMKQMKAIRQMRPMKPMRKNAWSNSSIF